MKFLIIGDGRHGKDTAATYLCEMLNLRMLSSSEFANERCVYPVLKDKYGYETPDECFQDRHQHRAEWKQLISEYCNPPERLVEELLEHADVYVGLRDRLEYVAARNLFDVVIWVDASDRLPPEDSNDLTPEDADVIVNNNGTELDLYWAVHAFVQAYRRTVIIN